MTRKITFLSSSNSHAKKPHSFSKSSLSSRNLSRKNLSFSPSLPVLPGKLQPPMEKNPSNRQTTPTCLAVASLHYLPPFLPPSSFRPISPTTLHHYLANNRRRSLIQQPADLHATCQPSIGTSKTTYDFALPSQKETRDWARLFHVAKTGSCMKGPKWGSTTIIFLNHNSG